ncbi:MAG: hypothetical protein P4L41_17480 [Flavipsychrobacter sp.]|nr:hypothetical protein [Flavipsychrobacter sp.]
MKKSQWLSIVITCIGFITSCCQPTPPASCSAQADYQKKHIGTGHRPGNGAGSSAFIPMDSANKMIGSYLASVNAPATDTALDCVIVDADMLRSYLNDTCNGKIKNVKFMLAHTLNYINTGHGGQYAGYKPNALTIIVSGYDATGNYILAAGNTVLDQGQACPVSCPISGNATNNIVINASQSPK